MKQYIFEHVNFIDENTKEVLIELSLSYQDAVELAHKLLHSAINIRNLRGNEAKCCVSIHGELTELIDDEGK